MNEPQFDRLMEVLWAICERLPAPEPRSAEPEGLDAETLARALVNVRPYGGNPGAWALPVARAILAEYARLRGEQR